MVNVTPASARMSRAPLDVTVAMVTQPTSLAGNIDGDADADADDGSVSAS